MAEMLGANVLPESVMAQRRKVRERVRDLRDPLRQRRESLVPGPDIIGQTESRLSDFRDQLVRRQGVLSSIRARRSGDGSGDDGGNGTSDTNESNSDGTNTGGMT